jgi:hypothetical protein
MGPTVPTTTATTINTNTSHRRPHRHTLTTTTLAQTHSPFLSAYEASLMPAPPAAVGRCNRRLAFPALFELGFRALPPLTRRSPSRESAASRAAPGDRRKGQLTAVSSRDLLK